MTPLSNISGKQIKKFVESLGYRLVRQRGSHLRFKHQYKLSITIPAIGKKTIKPGLLKGLLNKMEVEVEVFYSYLRYDNFSHLDPVLD